MSRLDRYPPATPPASNSTKLRALAPERRIAPGRAVPERINPPSKLQGVPPKGKDNTGMKVK